MSVIDGCESLHCGSKGTAHRLAPKKRRWRRQDDGNRSRSRPDKLVDIGIANVDNDVEATEFDGEAMHRIFRNHVFPVFPLGHKREVAFDKFAVAAIQRAKCMDKHATRVL